MSAELRRPYFAGIFDASVDTLFRAWLVLRPVQTRVSDILSVTLSMLNELCHSSPMCWRVGLRVLDLKS